MEKISSFGVRIKSLLFEHKDTRQTIAKNTFWLTVSNVGGRAIRALIVIYAVRALGATGWGVFSYALTIATFFTLFVDFGINSILIKESSKAEDHRYRSRVISTSFYMKIALLAAGTIAVVFIVPHFSALPAANAIFPIVALIFIFDTLRQFAFSVNQAAERMEREAALYLLTNILIVVIGALLLYVHPTVRAYADSYALGTGLGTLATFIALRKQLAGIFSDFVPGLVKKIVAASWPFAISGLLGALLINTDILMIGWFRTAEDVGLYSAIYRVIQILYLLPSIIATSTLPVFSRLAKRENEKMKELIERLLGFVFFASLPLAMCGAILARAMTVGLFGPAYAAATASFQVLLITLIIDFSAVILSNVVFSYDRQRNLIIYSALGGGFNVLFDLFLIPHFGIVGSAFATLFAQIISNWYLWRLVRKSVPFSIFPHLKKIALATVLAAALTFALSSIHLNYLIIVIIAVPCYLAMLKWLKEPLIREFGTLMGRSEEHIPSVPEV